jgi:hypothetical protein
LADVELPYLLLPLLFGGLGGPLGLLTGIGDVIGLQ